MIVENEMGFNVRMGWWVKIEACSTSRVMINYSIIEYLIKLYYLFSKKNVYIYIFISLIKKEKTIILYYIYIYI